jgi:hypothetical protein
MFGFVTCNFPFRYPVDLTLCPSDGCGRASLAEKRMIENHTLEALNWWFGFFLLLCFLA